MVPAGAGAGAGGMVGTTTDGTVETVGTDADGTPIISVPWAWSIWRIRVLGGDPPPKRPLDRAGPTRP